jgi:hypothetical protein
MCLFNRREISNYEAVSSKEIQIATIDRSLSLPAVLRFTQNAPNRLKNRWC